MCKSCLNCGNVGVTNWQNRCHFILPITGEECRFFKQKKSLPKKAFNLWLRKRDLNPRPNG